MRHLTLPHMLSAKAALWAIAALSLASTGCLTADMEGRPCEGQDDCIEGYVCTGRLCIGEETPLTKAVLTSSPLCNRVYPDEINPEENLSSYALLGAALPTSYAPTNAGDRERALRLAVDEINDAGGINDKRLALAVCDTAADTEQAVEVVDFLSTFAQVPAVIGCATSANTLASFTRSARRTGTLMISPSATSTRITDFVDNGLLWRVAPSDAYQGRAMAEWVNFRQYERVAVLFRDDAYGDGLEEVFADTLCAQGSSVCSTENYFVRSFPENMNASSISTSVDAAAAFGADVIMIFGFSDDAERVLLSARDNVDLSTTEFFASDAAKQASLGTALGGDDICSRVFGSGPVPFNPDDLTSPYGRFALDYVARFAVTPTAFTAHNYDALFAAALAYSASAADKPTGADLAIGLSRLSAGAAFDVGGSDFSAARAALATAGSIDLTGASGPLDFDTTGDVLGDIGLWRLVKAGTSCDLNDVSVIYEASTDTFVAPAL